jgi:hypothetical protein
MAQKQIYKRKGRVGVPTGYKHRWVYKGVWKEKKKRGYWNINFRATKKRGGSKRGGLGRGDQIVWGINAIQVAKKTGGRKYETQMRGRKYPLRAKIKGKWVNLKR